MVLKNRELMSLCDWRVALGVWVSGGVEDCGRFRVLSWPIVTTNEVCD